MVANHRKIPQEICTIVFENGISLRIPTLRNPEIWQVVEIICSQRAPPAVAGGTNHDTAHTTAIRGGPNNLATYRSRRTTLKFSEKMRDATVYSRYVRTEETRNSTRAARYSIKYGGRIHTVQVNFD